MSQNIVSISSETELKTSSPKTKSKKNRKKYDNLKLPTPPPDPREYKKEENCTENEFLEYLENLQKQTRTSTSLASALVADDAFDHLERLYKLMEQMIELRAQNAKLHRKIQDLEHLNNLEKMYKEVENSADHCVCPELDQDTAFAETILESILCEPKQQTVRTKASFRNSLMKKQRNRSSSAIDNPIGLSLLEGSDRRRASLCVASMKKQSKVSKWTRVKAAFKWEKAAPNVTDMKSSDNAPLEIARYLRVPSGDEAGHSRSDSGAAEVSTPGSLSSASSNENFHQLDGRSLNEEARSSDDDQSRHYSLHSKEDSNHSPKSLPSPRSDRTRWTKMKDMINPVRKKSRHSTNSDEIHIDIEPCSDNEDVFEDKSKSSFVSTSNIKMEKESRVKEEYSDSENTDSKKISKWLKVRKAFLQGHEIHDENSTEKEVPESGVREIQLEIDRNYRNLQKKLSIEFQEKLIEWNKIKQNSSMTSSPTPSGSQNDEISTTNPAFMKKIEEWERIKAQPLKPKTSIQMTSEENLPPEFRKKLHEWEKIKKSSMRKSTKKIGDLPRWKSMQHPKTSDSNVHAEIPIISEEFKKKLEEWKHIKATGYKSDDSEKRFVRNNTPSPKLNRIDSKVVKDEKDDKKLQWFEKELSKIEKERGRLEKERQKFIEREERLSKLRKTVIGGNKKDILVHTSSGFYKFEGISRKFTQKLYEWEKSRGIGPEASTFAFITPDLSKPIIPKVKINGKDHTPPLGRSRSFDGMIKSALNTSETLVKEPSSLSLNDIEELEKECLANSKTSLSECLSTFRSLKKETEEPEALIVEVEDIVEETASLLNDNIEHHNPVYQCEESRFLRSGDTSSAPNIRRSESSRAQTNYSLIEDALLYLRHLAENDDEIMRIRALEENLELDDVRVKELSEQQALMIIQLTQKLRKLQEENKNFISSLTKEDSEPRHNIIEILEVVQDFSNDILHMTEELNKSIHHGFSKFVNIHGLSEKIEEIKMKILDLRRHLSYICAALDSTPNKRKLFRTNPVGCEKNSNDSQSTNILPENTEKKHIYIKSETKNIQNQGAIKKRIRYKIENIRRKSLQDSEEDEEYCLGKNEKQKVPKFMRSKTLSESSTKTNEETDVVEKKCKITPIISNPIYVEANPTDLSPLDSPVTIFVKTTRKLFTPLVEKHSKDVDDEIENSSEEMEIESEDMKNNEDTHENQREKQVISTEIESKALPPNSPPTTQKKNMSPNIRLMLARYNDKLFGQDSLNKSGGSSGSVSPVAWRSPTSTRRVKDQTEKYQEEIKKSSISQNRGCDVQKSSSQGFIPTNQNENEPKKGKIVFKSSSASHLLLKRDENVSTKLISELRLKKLKKAKEDFLSSGPSSSPFSSDPKETFPNYKRNRLSQISVNSNNSSTSSISPGILTKSISAGMIYVDEETYKKFNGINRDCVSLPRNMKRSGCKSTLNSIAAKFKKVRMRKGKEKDAKSDLPAVSELCRQSLVVDLNLNDQQNLGNNCRNRIEDQHHSSGILKSSSWIRAKIFKK